VGRWNGECSSPSSIRNPAISVLSQSAFLEKLGLSHPPVHPWQDSHALGPCAGWGGPGMGRAGAIREPRRRRPPLALSMSLWALCLLAWAALAPGLVHGEAGLKEGEMDEPCPASYLSNQPLLILGVAKSGTTDLWTMLRRHPCIVSLIKEPAYFGRCVPAGVAGTEDFSWQSRDEEGRRVATCSWRDYYHFTHDRLSALEAMHRHNTSVSLHDDSWAEEIGLGRHTDARCNKTLFVDATPFHFLLPHVPSLIQAADRGVCGAKDTGHTAKLIIMLREPVERALSSFHWGARVRTCAAHMTPDDRRDPCPDLERLIEFQREVIVRR
jgi:hypothetical protein